MEISNKCQICNEYFSLSYRPIGLYDCGHLIHTDNSCYNKFCYECNDKKQLVDLSLLKKKSPALNNLMCITRKPVKFTWFDRFRGIYKLVKLLPRLIILYIRLYFNFVNLPYLFSLNDFLVKLLAINIKCSTLSKARLKDKSYKRVLICNHTNFHDTLVLGTLLSPSNICGFVAADIINKTIIGRTMCKLFPNIILKEKSNYNNIIKFWDEYPSETKLLIFPEGMLTHHKTLGKFRSTAFNIGKPIQPIIIKYEEEIFDLLNFDILCYKSINVEVKVANSIPINDRQDMKEKIRRFMCNLGDLILTDVINR